ncbi:unnamed protein product [Symbiodinium sp. CCMP2592]|nr:unnamed protein product [Symbiodinium sp. CCMP2592]
MGSMSSKGSGKGRPGPYEPLGVRVEQLEAKLAALEAIKDKEHAEKEKTALLELAAERGRAEAVQTLAASEGLHGIRLPTRKRSRSRGGRKGAAKSDDESEEPQHNFRSRVIAASDFSELWASVGITAKSPSGVWTLDRLVQSVINRSDFDRRKWSSQAKQLLDGPAPRDNAELVRAMLKASGA